jgi:XTP/dITP diphosphohydrolase
VTPFAPGALVIASHNEGKVREIRALLSPYGIEPVSAASLNLPEPPETGTSFAENALLKAVAACTRSGIRALSDDSGLCVDALDGAPGVYTADWAETVPGESASRDWMLAMRKVEDRLQALASGAPGGDISRRAHFVCTLALAWPNGDTMVFAGRVDGTLVWPPRGSRGFGYDPVFVPDGYVETFGELDPVIKHRIGHRADAFNKLVAMAVGR